MTTSTTQLLIATLGSGVVSGLVVTGAQAFVRRGERASDVRERRRHEAARVVGAALAVLRDLEPEANIGALRSTGDQTRPILMEKWEKWLAASGGLEELGATHPESDVDRLCQSVIEKGTTLIGRIQIGIYDGAQAPVWWDETKRTHTDAMSDGRNLVKAVVKQPV